MDSRVVSLDGIEDRAVPADAAGDENEAVRQEEGGLSGPGFGQLRAVGERVAGM